VKKILIENLAVDKHKDYKIYKRYKPEAVAAATLLLAVLAAAS